MAPVVSGGEPLLKNELSLALKACLLRPLKTEMLCPYCLGAAVALTEGDTAGCRGWSGKRACRAVLAPVWEALDGAVAADVIDTNVKPSRMSLSNKDKGAMLHSTIAAEGDLDQLSGREAAEPGLTGEPAAVHPGSPEAPASAHPAGGAGSPEGTGWCP